MSLEPRRSDILYRIADRHTRYLNTPISTVISEHDDMFVGNLQHYMSVGVSAVNLIVGAMVLALRDQFATVLDLPCGGGRVTRHLTAMFPDARLFASELDKAKETFVRDTFGVEPIVSSDDFGAPPQQQFDLVFVGSLLTHLSAQQFRKAVDWFVDALAPNGILVATTHGRKNASLGHYRDDAKPWYQACHRQYVTSGFGFSIYPGSGDDPNDPMAYGNSLASPSWVLGIAASRPDVRILSYAETAWANHQDAFILQKRSPTD